MSSGYDDLLARLRRVHLLGTVSGLLGWDEQVNLPPDSADQRADQLALLAELRHAAATDPVIAQRLDEVEQALPPATGNDVPAVFEQRVVVREARRDYERATRLPPEFVAEQARVASAAYHAWAQAKPTNDFARFAPFLRQHLDLARREAAYQGFSDRPYDYAIDKHDPGVTAAQIDRLFAELKLGLVPLVQRIGAVARRRPSVALRSFPVDRQRQFLREVTERIGFNYRRGRIDVSLHPFCEGAGADIRMTTRFAEDDPLSSLFGAIHETGHGLYEQGLPLELQGTPLGENAGMAMHESQSRMWENQVGRSRAFWRYYEPRFRELFGPQLAGISSDELYRAINAVRRTHIRVEADEVHYNLHIILRFELEKRLFAGELDVADLPAAWSQLSKELFGEAPPDDREGVLQDIHWSGGAFGYFPSYCLGNMIAAQHWATVRQQLPEMEEGFAAGEFRPLLDWLRTHIHQQGRRFPALELVHRVTGRPLSAQPLLSYLQDRYGELYQELRRKWPA